MRLRDTALFLARCAVLVRNPAVVIQLLVLGHIEPRSSLDGSEARLPQCLVDTPSHVIDSRSPQLRVCGHHFLSLLDQMQRLLHCDLRAAQLVDPETDLADARRRVQQLLLDLLQAISLPLFLASRVSAILDLAHDSSVPERLHASSVVAICSPTRSLVCVISELAALAPRSVTTTLVTRRFV